MVTDPLFELMNESVPSAAPPASDEQVQASKGASSKSSGGVPGAPSQKPLKLAPIFMKKPLVVTHAPSETIMAASVGVDPSKGDGPAVTVASKDEPLAETKNKNRRKSGAQSESKSSKRKAEGAAGTEEDPIHDEWERGQKADGKPKAAKTKETQTAKRRKSKSSKEQDVSDAENASENVESIQHDSNGVVIEPKKRRTSAMKSRRKNSLQLEMNGSSHSKPSDNTIIGGDGPVFASDDGEVEKKSKRQKRTSDAHQRDNNVNDKAKPADTKEGSNTIKAFFEHQQRRASIIAQEKYELLPDLGRPTIGKESSPVVTTQVSVLAPETPTATSHTMDCSGDGVQSTSAKEEGDNIILAKESPTIDRSATVVVETPSKKELPNSVEDSFSFPSMESLDSDVTVHENAELSQPKADTPPSAPTQADAPKPTMIHPFFAKKPISNKPDAPRYVEVSTPPEFESSMETNSSVKRRRSSRKSAPKILPSTLSEAPDSANANKNDIMPKSSDVEQVDAKKSLESGHAATSVADISRNEASITIATETLASSTTTSTESKASVEERAERTNNNSGKPVHPFFTKKPPTKPHHTPQPIEINPAAASEPAEESLSERPRRSTRKPLSQASAVPRQAEESTDVDAIQLSRDDTIKTEDLMVLDAAGEEELFQAVLKASAEASAASASGGAPVELDVTKINNFFLNKDQKRLKKILTEQEKLRKEGEERQKISADFSKGKALNPFLQPRKNSMLNGSEESAMASSVDSFFKQTKSSIVLSTLIPAAWPTTLNGHVGMLPYRWSCGVDNIRTPFKLKGTSRRLDIGELPIILEDGQSISVSPLVMMEEVSWSNSAETSLTTIEHSNDLMYLASTAFTSEFNVLSTTMSTTVLRGFLETLYGADLINAPSSKPLLDSLIGLKTLDTTSPNSLWCERFKPQTCSEVLGGANTIVTSYIKEWLQGWNPPAASTAEKSVLKNSSEEESAGFSRQSSSKDKSSKKQQQLAQLKKKRNTKKSKRNKIVDSDDDFVVADDDSDVFEDEYESEDYESGGELLKNVSRLKTHLRLLGPPGSGRTSSVQAAAEECNYEIIEFHAGQKRTGKDVNSFLVEATRSHAVIAESTSISAGAGGKASWANLLSTMNAQAKVAQSLECAKKVAEDTKPSAKDKAKGRKEEKKDRKRAKSKPRKKRRKGSDDEDEVVEMSSEEDEIMDDEDAVEDIPPKKEKGQLSLSFWMGGGKKTTSQDRANRAEQKRKAQEEDANVIEETKIPKQLKSEAKLKAESSNAIINDEEQEEPVRSSRKKARKSVADDDLDFEVVATTSKAKSQTQPATAEPPKKRSSRKSLQAVESETKPVIDVEAVEIDSKEAASAAVKPTFTQPAIDKAVSSSAQAKPSLILIEDADILFEEDKGFWAAIGALMEGSKRPIIMTSNDDPFNYRNQALPPQTLNTLLSFTDTLRFLHPTILEVACHTHLILLSMGIWVDPVDVFKIAVRSQGDTRRCLMEAEFWFNKRANSLNGSGDSKTLQVTVDRPSIESGSVPNTPFPEEQQQVTFTSVRPRMYESMLSGWKWFGKLMPSLPLEAGAAIDKLEEQCHLQSGQSDIESGGLVENSGTLRWIMTACAKNGLFQQTPHDSDSKVAEREMRILESMSKLCDMSAWTDSILNDDEWTGFELGDPDVYDIGSAFSTDMLPTVHEPLLKPLPPSVSPKLPSFAYAYSRTSISGWCEALSGRVARNEVTNMLPESERTSCNVISIDDIGYSFAINGASPSYRYKKLAQLRDLVPETCVWLPTLFVASKAFTSDIYPFLAFICRLDTEESFKARRPVETDENGDDSGGQLRRTSRRQRLLRSTFVRHFSEVLSPDQAAAIGKSWIMEPGYQAVKGDGINLNKILENGTKYHVSITTKTL
ncbi:ATPase AAA domain-containing protein 5 [Chytridiales sp. JEL 0842]|nr:ATPase AAA domain-containing protein 5 [Chytridiales sp. JEL 0842]